MHDIKNVFHILEMNFVDFCTPPLLIPSALCQWLAGAVGLPQRVMLRYQMYRPKLPISSTLNVPALLFNFEALNILAMAPRRRKVAQDTPADIKDSSSAGSKVSMAASDNQDAPNSGGWSTQAQWLFFAIASGICAACNGAFAKLYVMASIDNEGVQDA